MFYSHNYTGGQPIPSQFSYTSISSEISPLHTAAKGGDVKELLRLLATKPSDVNKADGKFRFTPLHFAAGTGELLAAKHLVDFGANLNAWDNSGSTPLYIAAAHGKADFVKFLLSENADGALPANTAFGKRKVSNPMEEGNFIDERLFLSPDSDLLTDSALNILELWSLDSALAWSRFALEDVCLATPLHRAARAGHRKVVEALLGAGMDIDCVCKVGTPLHAAAIHCKPEMVKYLLLEGADPTKCANLGIATPLHWAAYSGDLATIKLLLAKDTSCLKAKAARYRDSTPLHWAAMNNNPEVLRYLISKGANVKARCSDGSTPVHWAAAATAFNDPSVLINLIAFNGNVHAIANDGSTPLHWASYNGCRNAMKRLYLSGANGTSKTYDGYTAKEVWMWAFDSKNIDLGHLDPSNFEGLRIFLESLHIKGVKFDKDRFCPPFWKSKPIDERC